LYYDHALLEEKIYSVINNLPICRFWRETSQLVSKNAHLKRVGSAYPFWLEPYMVGTEYTFFTPSTIARRGVVAIEAIKK
jgi:hypothetical protein